MTGTPTRTDPELWAAIDRIENLRAGPRDALLLLVEYRRLQAAHNQMTAAVINDRFSAELATTLLELADAREHTAHVRAQLTEHQAFAGRAVEALAQAGGVKPVSAVRRDHP